MSRDEDRIFRNPAEPASPCLQEGTAILQVATVCYVELGEGMQASQCHSAAVSEEFSNVGIVDIQTTS